MIVELSLDYMNKVAAQTQFISALLCGFSLTVLVLLFDNNNSGRLWENIFRFATVATGAFLIAIFSMTKVLMMTTAGFPFPVEDADLSFPRVIGILAFFIGIVSIAVIISLFGWTKSKALGRFTTIIGIITLVLMILMLG